MRGAVLYGPRDVRFEERKVPKIINPTDAVIRISSACVCGSDLWPYRGIQTIAQPTPMGHEYLRNCEEVGSAVQSVKRGQFVIGSFFASDNVCPNLSDRFTSHPASTAASCRRCTAPSCAFRSRMAPWSRRLTFSSEDLIPSLLTLSESWVPVGSQLMPQT